jgi:hypothetical protein
MRHACLHKLMVSLLIALAAGSAVAAGAPGAALCRADLEEIAAFVAVNDSGAAEAKAHHGGAIDTALEQARTGIARLAGAPADVAACDAILTAYLRAWRPGHLSVTQLAAAGGAKRAVEPGNGADPRLPRLKILGQDTLLLVVPSFKDPYQAPLAALLEAQRAALETHKYWIIDVRDNGGGADTTYEPLLPWLLDGDYLSHRLEYLVTAANIQAQEDICGQLTDPAACRRQMAPTIQAMKSVRPGSFATRPGERVSVERPARLEPKAPQRVAVLVDRGCGSSCDQFALTVKSGFRVKLAGRPSAGEAEVRRVQRWLETGRL